MLDNIIHSHIGWFHFITSVLALIAGTTVLLNAKGTKFHKRVGYLYVISMLALNIKFLLYYKFWKL